MSPVGETGSVYLLRDAESAAHLLLAAVLVRLALDLLADLLVLVGLVLAILGSVAELGHWDALLPIFAFPLVFLALCSIGGVQHGG